MGEGKGRVLTICDPVRVLTDDPHLLGNILNQFIHFTALLVGVLYDSHTLYQTGRASWGELRGDIVINIRGT